MWVTPDVVINNVMEIAGWLMFMGCCILLLFLSLFALNFFFFLTPANKLTFKSQKTSSPFISWGKIGKREKIPLAGRHCWVHPMLAPNFLEKLKVAVIVPFHSEDPLKSHWWTLASAFNLTRKIKQRFLWKKKKKKKPSKICDRFEVSPEFWPVFLEDVALLLLEHRMLMKSRMKCCYRCSALHLGCWNYHHILNQFPEHCLEVMSLQ